MTDSSAKDRFDRWIGRSFNRLRQRLMVSCIFDDDAFQETYLSLRETVTEEQAGCYEAVFTRQYKRTIQRLNRQELRYFHPDPLFFLYLRTEPVVFDGEDIAETDGGTPEPERMKKRITEYVRMNYSEDDYLLFQLKYFSGMTYKCLQDYTGHGSEYIARHLNNIRAGIVSNFTPPLRQLPRVGCVSVRA